MRWVVRAVAAFFKPKASLVAENLCLRQQILVLQRRHPRPRLQDKDRRFWILASRCFCALQVAYMPRTVSSPGPKSQGFCGPTGFSGGTGGRLAR